MFKFHRHNFVTIAEKEVIQVLKKVEHGDYLFGIPPRTIREEVKGILVYKYCNCGKHKAEFVTHDSRTKVEPEYARSKFKNSIDIMDLIKNMNK